MPDPWEVPGSLEGERIDRVVALVAGLARNDAGALIAAGRVFLDGVVVRSRSRRLRSGQRILIAGDTTPARRTPPAADPSVEVPLVWSDRHVIVVDKPPGVVVHPGAGNPAGTLVNGLLACFPDLAELAGPGAGTEDRQRPGIVHRLDKGTSGLMVVARSAQARDSLRRQLAARRLVREYIALVRGEVAADAGLIDAPLGRSGADPTRMGLDAGGRPARTRYRVLERLSPGDPLTLLECRLETGRTHQIRVHLASLGHPIVGDDKYGRAGAGRWPPLPTGRSFLHACELSFEHPLTGRPQAFSSGLPADLRDALGAAREVR